MQVVNTLLVLIFLFFLIRYISALRNPHQKSLVKPFGKNPSRTSLSKGFLPVIGVLFILISITVPPMPPSTEVTSQTLTEQHDAQAKKLQETARLQAIEDAKPITKEETVKEAIPFTTETNNDASLPLGQTKTTREGSNGEKSLTYTVTYESGKETARTLKEELVTTTPITKVIATGTYVYTPPPSSEPTGATARCEDGTYSYSQHRSGTCSHHGGVASWL